MIKISSIWNHSSYKTWNIQPKLFEIKRLSKELINLGINKHILPKISPFLYPKNSIFPYIYKYSYSKIKIELYPDKLGKKLDIYI